MPTGLVLVIEDDEWVSRLVSEAIRDAGYDAIVCDTAKGGVETAAAVSPDCIVCDVDLPDHDGFWVAREVRTLSSKVSTTPFLFLSSRTDQRSRLEGFHVGADVYMTKPFRVDEVVAQIAALVQMASRLRQRRASFLSAPAGAPGAQAAAIEGDLAQMSIATVLTLLEMERRSGTLEVTSKKRAGQLEIASGFLTQGSLGGSRVSALAALRTLLGWKVGRFSFAPGPPREPPPNQKTVGAFLIEAVRLDDETARSDLDPAASRRPPGSEPAGQRRAPPSGLIALDAEPSSIPDFELAPASNRPASAQPASAPPPGRAPPPPPPRRREPSER